MAKQMSDIIMRNARLIFRNFAGKADNFNAAGNRNFSVVIEDAELAEQLKGDGWNVKMRPPREEGADPLYYLPVKVNFGGYKPPKVYKVDLDMAGNQKRKIQLDEESIDCLDYAELKKCDLKISPYIWEIGDKSGVKAYLSELYACVQEDELEALYGNVEDDGVPFV